MATRQSMQQIVPNQSVGAIQDPLAPGNFGQSYVQVAPPTQPSTLASILPGLIGGGLLAGGLALANESDALPYGALGAIAGGLGGWAAGNRNNKMAQQQYALMQQAANRNNQMFQKNIGGLRNDLSTWQQATGLQGYNIPEPDLSSAGTLEAAREIIKNYQDSVAPWTNALQTRAADRFMNQHTQSIMGAPSIQLPNIQPPMIPGQGKLGSWQSDEPTLRTSTQAYDATQPTLAELARYNFPVAEVQQLGRSAADIAKTPSDIQQNLSNVLRNQASAEESKAHGKLYGTQEQLQRENNQLERELTKSQIERNRRPTGGGKASKPNAFEVKMDWFQKTQASMSPESRQAYLNHVQSGLPLTQPIYAMPDGSPWIGGKVVKLRHQGKMKPMVQQGNRVYDVIQIGAPK